MSTNNDKKQNVSHRFSVTIHDDNGKMSMDICDQNTMTQTTITAQDFNKYKNEGFNVYAISKILIGIIKDKYIRVVDKRSSNVQPFPDWNEVIRGIDDSRFDDMPNCYPVREGARIMYDRLYSMLSRQQ